MADKNSLGLFTLGAGDGNRTRILSLGSWARLAEWACLRLRGLPFLTLADRRQPRFGARAGHDSSVRLFVGTMPLHDGRTHERIVRPHDNATQRPHHPEKLGHRCLDST